MSSQVEDILSLALDKQHGSASSSICLRDFMSVWLQWMEEPSDFPTSVRDSPFLDTLIHFIHLKFIRLSQNENTPKREHKTAAIHVSVVSHRRWERQKIPGYNMTIDYATPALDPDKIKTINQFGPYPVIVAKAQYHTVPFLVQQCEKTWSTVISVNDCQRNWTVQARNSLEAVSFPTAKS